MVSSNIYTKLRISKEASIIYSDYLTKNGLLDTQITSETMSVDHTLLETKNINNTRQGRKKQRVSRDITGGIKFHLSPYIYDKLIEGVFWSSWLTTNNTISINISIIDNTIVDSENTGAFVNFISGQFIYIRRGGTVSDDNCGIYKISAKTTDNSMVLDDIMLLKITESNVTAKISGSILRLPETVSDIERHSYFIEKQQIDTSPSQYISFKSNYVNKLSLNCMSKSFVSGGFDFIGKSASVYNDGIYDIDNNPNGNGVGSVATLNGNDLIQAYDTNFFNTSTDITDIYIDDVRTTIDASSDIWVQSINFSIINNFKGINALSETDIIGVSPNTMSISGTMSIYFSDTTIHDLYMNGLEFSLMLIMENINKDAYVFSFPRIKITGSNLNYQNDSLTTTIQWIALYDETVKTSIQIDRLFSSYVYETYDLTLNGHSLTLDDYNLVSVRSL